MSEIKQKKNEIEEKKNKIFDKYYAKPGWRKEIGEKIWEEIENIKKADLTCVALKYQKLQDLKSNYGTDKNKFLNDLKSEVLKLKDILWDNRELTEEIAPEIIEDFDSVKIKEGKIYITVALPLGPFFKDEFEEIFQELRLGRKWKDYIDFDKEGKGTLCNEIFTYDSEERKLEKECYDIKAFRGITYNEILTPIYNLDNKTEFFKKIKDEIKKPSKILESKKAFVTEVVGKIEKILEEKWDIKVRITKGGLVNIFFKRKDILGKNIDFFAEEKRNWMIDPYFDEKLSNSDAKQFAEGHKLLKEEQIFTSYLNVAAIWITHIFLKGCREKITDILGINKNVDYLNPPWDVRYKSVNTKPSQLRPDFIPVGSNINSDVTNDTPPLRNYFFVFHLKDIKGIGWGGKIITTEEHFDCPANIKDCPKRAGDNCFIILFGHLLLALSTNTYVVKGNNLKRPWFTQKELENFAKRDLSRWRGELCFIDSETILICTSSRIVKINKEGQPVDYDTYWKSIIKGFSLLLSCKTLAMDVSRLLFDSIWQYRENEEGEEKEVLKRLRIISHLLSRIRFIATPSNISRARYVREKLEVYIKAIGLPEIINNIEKDYDELDKAIHSSIELKINSKIFWLTVFMAVLTFVLIIMELYKK